MTSSEFSYFQTQPIPNLSLLTIISYLRVGDILSVELYLSPCSGSFTIHALCYLSRLVHSAHSSDKTLTFSFVPKPVCPEHTQLQLKWQFRICASCHQHYLDTSQDCPTIPTCKDMVDKQTLKTMPFQEGLAQQ